MQIRSCYHTVKTTPTSLRYLHIIPTYQSTTKLNHYPTINLSTYQPLLSTTLSTQQLSYHIKRKTTKATITTTIYLPPSHPSTSSTPRTSIR
ncbi:hypothetical protein Pcinc_011303 [Petrolisthes cinctipes]|uniref:Uncharacterized protein n=1 Tax=Petrolisthes cinctipes TaxID=88211 RepID=A0AAE1G165_PETCI|nr:hypothetical protein Pcinc_011303 [Petrolisthes cinctipes]